MKLDNLRVANSNYCELNCSYCPSTNSRSEHLAMSLPNNLGAHTLACNTVYRDDLNTFLTASMNSSSVEIHFLTLTNPRMHSQINTIINKNYRLIVIVDHLDQAKINNLKPWDNYVSEYRVIPSRLYSIETYLSKLPYFIHSKLQWAFPPKQSHEDQLLSADEIYWSLEKLKNLPFSSSRVSQHLWQKTWEPSIVNKVKKYMTLFVRDSDNFENISVITNFVAHENFSQTAIDMALAESLYVGIFSKINESALEEIQNLGYDLIYFTPSEYTELPLLNSDLAVKNREIFLLENFVIRKDLWLEYINSNSQINEYTWNQFLNQFKDRIIIKKFSNPEIPNSRKNDVQKEFVQQYHNDPKPTLYKELFLISSPHNFFRQIFFYLFHFMYTALNYVPKRHTKKITALTLTTNKFTMSAVYNINDELKDTTSNVKRAFIHIRYLAYRCFWFAYNRCCVFYGQILKRLLYGTLIRKYLIGYFITKYLYGLILKKYLYGYLLQHLIFHTILRKILFGTIFYNFLYGKLFCRLLYGTIWAPICGFMTSLSEYPDYVDHLSFAQRIKVKSYFVLKKFGWLALRTIGMR